MSPAEEIARKLYCLGCGRRYRRGDLQLIGVGSGELDLYLHCTSCDLYAQLTIGKDDAVVKAMAAAAAPKPAADRPERHERLRSSPVSDEDVAAIRHFLSSFTGDVHRLLEGSRD